MPKLKTINGKRECFSCKEIKNVSEFYHRKTSDGVIRPYSTCKECQKAYSKNVTKTQKERISGYKKKYAEEHKDELRIKKIGYYNKNKERCLENARKHRLKTCFGITVEEYENMLLKQDNKCAICGCDSSQSRYGLVVDHDHSTKKVRSLLCNNCNTGIGLMREDTSILENAILYINKHKTL